MLIFKHKLHHFLLLHRRAHRAPERLLGTERGQHVAPDDLLDIRAQLLAVEQYRGAGIQNPGGHVHPLQVAPQAQEFPTGVLAHGAAEQAVDLLAALDDGGEEFVAVRAVDTALDIVVGVHIQLVDQLPGFRRNHVPGGADVLPHHFDRAHHGTVVGVVGQQELHHVALVLVLVALFELRRTAVENHQVVPADIDPGRQIEDDIGVDAHQPRGALHPLQVAGQPVDALGDARQHSGGLHQLLSVSTIQVSLLPPPWEELTTSDPLTIATRVRPPVVT